MKEHYSVSAVAIAVSMILTLSACDLSGGGSGGNNAGNSGTI